MACSRLGDLKSGVVVLALLFKVFPRLVERKLRMRWTPRFDHEITLNWDAIEHAIASLRLPAELFDRDGLQASRFRPTYNLLVTLFFLQQVAVSSDFTADFSHPIEPSLAYFLQSRAAVESMVAGGAISPPPPQAPPSSETSVGGDDVVDGALPLTPAAASTSCIGKPRSMATTARQAHTATTSSPLLSWSHAGALAAASAGSTLAAVAAYAA